jgi:tetratricopeptide (TPR) repeat protein
MPDIALLGPIARLLHISVNELLSYREDLTEEEISQYVAGLDEKIKNSTYEEAFQWGKALLEEYPHCEKLLWQIALILDANRLFCKVEDKDQYDSCIVGWYKRALESKDERIRYGAADSLYSFYMRKEDFEEAEKCLDYFSMQNPQKKQKRANLLWKKGNKESAYKDLEELIFSEFQMLQMALQSLYLMAMDEGNLEKAAYYVKKQKETARVSEFGSYHENAYGLELLAQKKDIDGTITWMEKVLGSVETIWDFTKSQLYEHMTFKKTDSQFAKEMRVNLKNSMKDEEAYGYLAGNERWERLIREE